jgi:hypothetical protein
MGTARLLSAARHCAAPNRPAGHGLEPKVTEDPAITAIARRVHKTPVQVALAWAAQRGAAFLTTSSKSQRIRENFDIATLPEDAMREIQDNLTTKVRFNQLVGAGLSGFFLDPPSGVACRHLVKVSKNFVLPV